MTDTNALETQLRSWLVEGYSTDDILAQARHNWPDLAAEKIKDALMRLAEPSSGGNPLSLGFLKTIHQKRLSEIERVESRLNDEKCPLAMHTLYRGLLRDAEAQCFKIMDLERQLQLDKEKRYTQDRKQQYQADLAQARRYEQLLKKNGYHERSDDEEAEDEPALPRNTKAGKTFTSFSCLVGIVLSLLLAGCSCIRCSSLRCNTSVETEVPVELTLPVNESIEPHIHSSSPTSAIQSWQEARDRYKGCGFPDETHQLSTC